MSVRWALGAGDRAVYRTARLAAQPSQSDGRALIPGAHELRPAAAIDEQVHQPAATAQPGIGGVDDRQRVAELALRASRELDVIGLLQLTAGQHDPHRLSVPSGDVVRLRPSGSMKFSPKT